MARAWSFDVLLSPCRRTLGHEPPDRHPLPDAPDQPDRCQVHQDGPA